MAWEIPGFNRSWIAGGIPGSAGSDLSISQTINGITCPNGFQYMFVKFSGGVLVPVAAATDKVVGILQNKPAPTQAATVMISGVSRCRSNDSSITVGTPIYIDAYGMATSTAQTKQCVGVAEEVAAAANGYIIAVCLRPFGAFGV